LDCFVTALCQIRHGFRLVSELSEYQRNRPDRKTRSVSGTVRKRDLLLDLKGVYHDQTNGLIHLLEDSYFKNIIDSK